jgi:hypothetical protein
MGNRIGNNLIHFGSNEVLVRTLISYEVEFVVIGGLAIAWHCPLRSADDMDLLVNPTIENSRRLSNALASLQIGDHSSDSFAKPGLQVPIKEAYYAELLTLPDGSSSFDQVESAAVDAFLFNIPVRLASVATLIQMKRKAIASDEEPSAKHADDLKLLEDLAERDKA